MKHTGLDAISQRTVDLWEQVNKMYGEHAYSLCVNGLSEVILCKGYTQDIAKGNRQAQKVLRELLARKEKTV